MACTLQPTHTHVRGEFVKDIKVTAETKYTDKGPVSQVTIIGEEAKYVPVELAAASSQNGAPMTEVARAALSQLEDMVATARSQMQAMSLLPKDKAQTDAWSGIHRGILDAPTVWFPMPGGVAEPLAQYWGSVPKRQLEHACEEQRRELVALRESHRLEVAQLRTALELNRTDVVRLRRIAREIDSVRTGNQNLTKSILDLRAEKVQMCSDWEADVIKLQGDLRNARAACEKMRTERDTHAKEKVEMASRANAAELKLQSTQKRLDETIAKAEKAITDPAYGVGPKIGDDVRQHPFRPEYQQRVQTFRQTDKNGHLITTTIETDMAPRDTRVVWNGNKTNSRIVPLYAKGDNVRSKSTGHVGVIACRDVNGHDLWRITDGSTSGFERRVDYDDVERVPQATTARGAIPAGATNIRPDRNGYLTYDLV